LCRQTLNNKKGIGFVNKKALLVGLIIIVLGSGVGYWWQTSNNNAGPENALVLYGNVDIREVRLAFNGSEHVDEILVDEGDQVQSGQLLARLHTDRLQAALQRARAEVAALKAEAKAAALSYQRVKSMAERKLASTEEADLAAAKSHAASAHVDAAEAALAETDQALKDAQLYAPMYGVIRDRIVEPGDFVTPQTPVLTLASLDPVWVRTYVPETYLGRVKPGAPATITTDSYAGKVYQGWVGSISPTAEFTPKSVETPELRTRLVYQIRVFVCNPQFELRLGMPATVQIDLDANPAEISAGSRCAQASPQSGP
jgi:HlyD family secretion protein